MWRYTPETPHDWNIPSRAAHPALDCIIQWVRKHKQHSDYEILRLLATAEPKNDFTYLCQSLGGDGAGQTLSDKVCTLLSIKHDWDLDDCFWELFPLLRSHNGQQTFYDLCGRQNPKGEWHKECQRSFRAMDNKWERRSSNYGSISMGKFYLCRSSDDALYILIFHPELYHTLTTDVGRLQFYSAPDHDPYESIWADLLATDPLALDDLGRERGYI